MDQAPPNETTLRKSMSHADIDLTRPVASRTKRVGLVEDVMHLMSVYTANITFANRLVELTPIFAQSVNVGVSHLESVIYGKSEFR